MKYRLPFIALALVMISLYACNKSTDTFTATPVSDYFPLATGKYITYRLDSLVYVNFGTQEVIHSYEVKYETDAEITDNLGRPAYRVFRFIRNNSTEAWQPDATFFAVNTGNTLEFIENNMRFVKLAQPIRNNFSWKGNTYIDTYSFQSEVRYLDDWDYTYENVGAPDNVGTYSLAQTLTVNQRDEIIGNPGDPGSYSEKNFGVEKYARGIGMVYKYFLHNEYQPPTSSQNGYTVGYGITLTMIDHN